MNAKLSECADLDEVAAFFRQAWGADDPSAVAPETIAWRYRHACGDDAWRGRHIVFRADGRIAGHIGVLPVSIDAGAETIDAAWLLDWHVLAPWRGVAGGFRILREAESRHDLVMAVGLTTASESIFRRSDWSDGGLLERRDAILDPTALARRFLPASLRPLGAGVAAGVGQLYRSIIASRARGAAPEIVEADAPPAEAASLAATSDHDSVRIRRDDRFLAWRYGAPCPWPLRHFIARADGTTVGWSAWSVKERADHVRVARLLEHHVAPDAPDVEKPLLAAGLAFAAREKAHLVVISGRRSLPARLPGSLLWPRVGLRFMWKWRVGAEAAPTVLKTPANWRLSAGDSDQDR